jgi:hypothetical protein
VNREVTGSSSDLYTLHDVWERPSANNFLQTPHSAGAYGTGYIQMWVRKAEVAQEAHVTPVNYLQSNKPLRHGYESLFLGLAPSVRVWANHVRM